MSHSVDEYYSVYDEKFPRARAARPCDACKETVPRGDRYARVAILFEGRWQTVHRCMRCQRMHEHLRGQGCDTWPDERLDCGLDYEEEWCRPPPPEIEALAFQTGSDLQGDVEGAAK